MLKQCVGQITCLYDMDLVDPLNFDSVSVSLPLPPPSPADDRTSLDTSTKN